MNDFIFILAYLAIFTISFRFAVWFSVKVGLFSGRIDGTDVGFLLFCSFLWPIMLPLMAIVVMVGAIINAWPKNLSITNIVQDWVDKDGLK